MSGAVARSLGLIKAASIDRVETALGSASGPMTQPTERLPVIIDCDPGIDDAIALLLALASPEVELLGVTSVYGNHTVGRTAANAIRVLDHFGRFDIPVILGAPRPLVRELHVDTTVHGESGLEGSELPAASRDPETIHAIDWMAKTLTASPTPVTLVAIAPLTNVALLLARYPELASKLERIVLMGGSVAEGNMTPAAEFNIWADPEAAQRVFSEGLDVTMVGLDVTRRAVLGRAHVDRLAAAGRAGKLVARLYTFYAEFHRRHYGIDAAPMHDPVVIAHLIDASVLKTKRCAVIVDTGGEHSRGRTYVDQWGDTDWASNCDVALGIDEERFFDLLVQRVSALR